MKKVNLSLDDINQAVSAGYKQLGRKVPVWFLVTPEQEAYLNTFNYNVFNIPSKKEIKKLVDLNPLGTKKKIVKFFKNFDIKVKFIDGLESKILFEL